MNPEVTPSKKALIVAYHFAPLGSSGTFRSLKFVKYLRAYGWNAVVVSVKPEYEPLEPVDESLLQEIPPGTVVVRTSSWHPRQLLWRRRTSPVAGGTTATVAAKPSATRARNRGVRAWVRSLVASFGRGGWFPFATIAAIRAARQYDVDVVYTSGPPFACSLTGLVVKWFTRKPLVSDFRDPWGSNTYHDGSGSALTRISQWLERKTFEASDVVINISPDLDAKARARASSSSRSRFVVIPNGFDYDDIPARHSSRAIDEFRVTYTGCFYTGSREPTNFLRALALIKQQDPQAFGRIRANFVGEPEWADSNRALLDSLSLGEHASFRAFLPHREALGLLQDSDVLLMLGSVKATDTGSLPAKLFEYLAVGKPILALVHDGESAQFVRASGIGVVANPEQPADIATALLELRRRVTSGQFQTGVNRALLERHDRRYLAGELAAVFDETAGRRRSSSG